MWMFKAISRGALRLRSPRESKFARWSGTGAVALSWGGSRQPGQAPARLQRQPAHQQRALRRVGRPAAQPARRGRLPHPQSHRRQDPTRSPTSPQAPTRQPNNPPHVARRSRSTTAPRTSGLTRERLTDPHLDSLPGSPQITPDITLPRAPKVRSARMTSLSARVVRFVVVLLAAALVGGLAAQPAAANRVEPHTHDRVDATPTINVGHASKEGTNCGFWGCRSHFWRVGGQFEATYYLGDVQGTFKFSREIPKPDRTSLKGRVKWSLYEKRTGSTRYEHIKSFYPIAQEGRSGMVHL